MLHTRTDQENLESAHLRPYAAHSATSRGRQYPESRHDYRTDFQRDRDRIIYSSCFRRLEYKTQVFINGTADHYRTRLTHTFEMTAIGRTLARALRANEDLTEAIALAHDIGHSPFGHEGERKLDALMHDHGGFNHNTQSLRWVEQLESKYPGFPGLNLTWEVRAGLRKHQAAMPGAELDGHPIGPHQFIEAQIADTADDIAYYAHDVEDGIEAGLLTGEQLAPLALWQAARERSIQQFPDADATLRDRLTVRCLLDIQVEDVVQTSLARLAEYRPPSAEAVMEAPVRMVDFSPEMKQILQPHREFLFRNLYWHPEVEEANHDAVRMMTRLFLHYIDHPDVMGTKARARLPSEGLWRTACDYASGMTDRYAFAEYLKYRLDENRGTPAAKEHTP